MAGGPANSAAKKGNGRPRKPFGNNKKPLAKGDSNKISSEPRKNHTNPMKRKPAEQNSKQAKKQKKDNPETVKINKEIAQCASRKQSHEAQTLYLNAIEKKLANSYTYVNMMNVCVRCGDLAKSIEIFNDMKAAKIQPDVVAYTTLLKGLCGEGRLIDAMKYVKEMETNKVALNVRTVNTLLRGCILVGDISTAEKIFESTTGRWKVVPDASTWEYIIALFCRNLQLKKALSVFGRGLLACGEEVSANAATLLNLSRAATLLGDRVTADRYIAMTYAALEREPSTTTSTAEEGGKRAMGVESESRKESLAVFLKIKREELRRELAVIEDYHKKIEDDETSRIRAVVDSAKRVFLIPLVAPEEQTLASALSNGVLDTMGLRSLLKKHLPSKIDGIQEKFSSKLSSENQLRMKKVFGKENVKTLPIKVEICSGAGEWVVSQAKKDKALWIAMEIRHDRVYQIFTQSIFDQVDNLSIVAGDAAQAIPQHLPRELADFIFVNQPEPPQQTGNTSTQAKHLLTSAFMADCVQMLKSNGRLTIVTDNKWYAQLLLKTVSKLAHVRGVVLKKARQSVESIGSFHIYLGHPPKECGVADENSSSYFDRLAKQDNIRASQGTYFISIARTV